MKKETETALFTTETTQQKQHTTHNYSIYASVVISAHCCLHWCSHRHLASVLAPCIYPAILHWCSHLAFFHCSSLLGFFCTAITRAVRCLPWPTGAESAIMAKRLSSTWATSAPFGRCIMSRKPPGIGTGTKRQKMPNISFPQR